MNKWETPRSKRRLSACKRTNTFLPVIGLILMIVCFQALLGLIQNRRAWADKTWTGRLIMEEAFNRHELFPYVFEKQTMILMDDEGNRDVRLVRRFSRVEKDKTVKYLLVFDNPAEIRGVALLAVRHHSSRREVGIYLPALGKKLKFKSGDNGSSHFLGTDFAIGDLTKEMLSDFRYIRAADQKIDKIVYFVVEAFPKNEKIEQNTGYSLRRHFIRHDNFFIVRTDYFDRLKRFSKRQTRHDLKKVDGDMWRADMILMENSKERHKTLIKINQRVFSRDYTPPEVFTTAWLLENRHVQDVEKQLFQSVTGAPNKKTDEHPDVPQKKNPARQE
ncbi:outer membrane lipoprotein-sorting protein [Thermodesulfobacteriota bacterium]